MATITTGHNAPTGFISGETVTAQKLNDHVNAATITSIVNADISASANIAGSKLADDSVTAAKLDGVLDISAKTADYTLALADAGRTIEVNSASGVTITVPNNSSVAFATGATVVITRRGAGDVTIAAAGGVTLRSADSRLKIGKQYAAAAAVKIGTNEWMVLGNLKA